MHSSLIILRQRMKSTAYARFYSARRYDRLNNYSLFSLSLSSFILIFVSLIQKYSIVKIFDANNLELIQLLSSITIATLSVVVAFSSYSVKSEKMRISGEEINELISKIDYISDLPWEEKSIKKTKKIRAKYEILKAKSLIIRISNSYMVKPKEKEKNLIQTHALKMK
ncbi:TPA: SLATT domain-containing protein [Enterobacter hormaechei]